MIAIYCMVIDFGASLYVYFPHFLVIWNDTEDHYNLKVLSSKLER
jgi:hypothetical protein